MAILVGKPLLPEEASEIGKASIERSAEAFKVMLGDELLAHWGYACVGMNAAMIWAYLPEEARKKYPVAVARESMRICKVMLEKFPYVLAQVDKDFRTSVDWLTWLGFQVIKQEGSVIDMGLSGETFKCKH